METVHVDRDKDDVIEESKKIDSECTKAFGRELQKYLKEYKEKDSAENRHCMH